MAEQNNEFLMKNRESYLTGSSLFLEVNATIYNKRGCGHGRGKRRGHGRNNF